MGKAVTIKSDIGAMSASEIERVNALEKLMLSVPQEPIFTHHVIHAGTYSRTILMPQGVVITGALVKRSTTLIVSGDCTVFIGDDVIRLTGYNVLTASAGRKQAFLAHTDTYLTMSFATEARTIEEAEDEFTDESHLLMSRSALGDNKIMITGE